MPRERSRAVSSPSRSIAGPTTCSTIVNCPSGETMMRSGLSAPCATPEPCCWKRSSAGPSCWMTAEANAAPRARCNTSESRLPGVQFEISARSSSGSRRWTARIAGKGGMAELIEPADLVAQRRFEAGKVSEVRTKAKEFEGWRAAVVEHQQPIAEAVREALCVPAGQRLGCRGRSRIRGSGPLGHSFGIARKQGYVVRTEHDTPQLTCYRACTPKRWRLSAPANRVWWRRRVGMDGSCYREHSP